MRKVEKPCPRRGPPAPVCVLPLSSLLLYPGPIHVVYSLTTNSSFCSNVPALKAHPSWTTVAATASSLPGLTSYSIRFKALTLHKPYLFAHLLIYLFTVCLPCWKASPTRKGCLTPHTIPTARDVCHTARKPRVIVERRNE